MKHLPEDYQPKGQLEGFPLNIIEKMIEEQVAQGNPADVTIFEVNSCSTIDIGGFDLDRTNKERYWIEVIYRRNFDYPDPDEIEAENIVYAHKRKHEQIALKEPSISTTEVDKVMEDFANKHMDKFKPISEDRKQPELPVLRVSTAGEYYVEYSAGSDPKIVQEMMFAIESIGAKRRFDEIAKHMYEAKIQEGLL